MLQNQFLKALSFYLRAATAVGNLDWFSEVLLQNTEIKAAEEMFLAWLDCFFQNTGRGQSTRFSVLTSCSRKFHSVCRLSVNRFVVYCMFMLKLLQFCQKVVILTTGTR